MPALAFLPENTGQSYRSETIDANFTEGVLILAVNSTDMKFIHYIPSFLRNKYLLTLSVFAVWMVFFDKNDMFTQLERRKELAEIEDNKAYFAEKIEENKKFSRDIQSNAAAIEKFAREKYQMKRENEDLFIIVPAEEK